MRDAQELTWRLDIAWTNTIFTSWIKLSIAYIGDIVLGCYVFSTLWCPICIMEIVKPSVYYLVALACTDWSRMTKSAVKDLEVAAITEIEFEVDAFNFVLAESDSTTAL